jgi:hypothetical protein
MQVSNVHVHSIHAEERSIAISRMYHVSEIYPIVSMYAPFLQSHSSIALTSPACKRFSRALNRVHDRHPYPNVHATPSQGLTLHVWSMSPVSTQRSVLTDESVETSGLAVSQKG